MKFRRKPVERDVVDAILDEAGGNYMVKRATSVETIKRDDFERDYEPVIRASRKVKPATKRSRKQTTPAALP
jgi:hypothetical protein